MDKTQYTEKLEVMGKTQYTEYTENLEDIFRREL